MHACSTHLQVHAWLVRVKAWVTALFLLLLSVLLSLLGWVCRLLPCLVLPE